MPSTHQPRARVLPHDERTEQHRHRCEVRQLLRWRKQHGSDWAASWLGDVAKARGAPMADRLRRDAAAQWSAGNRGEPGDWR